ncbi:MAG: chromosome segregation protein SMC [Bacteroidota bacterium]
MYLSKLQLHGFKSFADRTTLHFDPGVTAVVGPNGCGKSNIVDAVRWVIGEQRARVLRSAKMENVIFNGTNKRRKLGMAEVLLTVENTRGILPTEYSEVTLGRRLYRSGDSEYLLNGVKCRLRDITDLFMDTGMGAGAYSVIELKMIEEILSDNAQDRRRLFEEAAGITKYKLRRRQTLSKLGNTQQDLSRVRDLVEEIEKNVRRLKRQAKKAAQYREWRDRLQHLDLALTQIQLGTLRAEQQHLEALLTELADQIGTQTAKQAQEEASLEALKKTLIDKEQALAERQRTYNAFLDEERRLETERRLTTQAIDTAHREQVRTRQEQRTAEARRTQLGETLDRLASALAEAEPQLAEAEQVLHDARQARDAAHQASQRAQAGLQSARAEERRAGDAWRQQQRDLDRLTNRLDLQRQERDRLTQQHAALSADAETLADRRAVADRNRDAASAAAERALAALDDAVADEAERREALEAARTAFRDAERTHDALAAEVNLLDSLVSSFEDFSEAVQFLASTPSWSEGELRTVADVLGCDPGDQVALDAALGERAAYIVVEDEAHAQQAIALLRQQQKGQATFIVLSKLTQVPEATGSLRAAVRVADSRYAPLADLLLRDAELTDTLAEAEAASEGATTRKRYYARTGEWVDAAGVVQGGSQRKGASPMASRMTRREQLSEAQTELADAARTLTQQRDALTDARASLTAAEAVLRTQRQAVRQTERALADAEKAATRADLDYSSFAQRRSDLNTRRNRAADAIADAESEIAPLERAVRDGEAAVQSARAAREAAEAEAATTDAASRTAASAFNEANLAAVQQRNRRDNLQRDRDRTHTTLADTKARIADFGTRLTELLSEIEAAQQRQTDLDAEIATAQTRRVDADTAVKVAENERIQARAHINDVEGYLRTRRRERDALISQENEHALRRHSLETKAEALLLRIQENYDLDLAAHPVAIDDAFDAPAAEVEAQDLRKKIRGLGPINELAVEVYAEESERLDFITGQLDDLEQAEATLLETIDEINTTATERFHETFAAIDAYFGKLFADLFGEDASAHLVLEDNADPLESAIDIKARPRGKKPSGIAQLSGGEKTLTAIALLFAIYLVKPSPFCILDEVDAPLDDANIDRFMHLIRSFADQTQFIIVTHNKRSMELADRMYGITMQETGVSKLVSVQFDDA